MHLSTWEQTSENYFLRLPCFDKKTDQIKPRNLTQRNSPINPRLQTFHQLPQLGSIVPNERAALTKALGRFFGTGYTLETSFP